MQRKFLRPGLWARAVAETGGEGERARALYIRLRVAELVEIEKAESARVKAERKRQAAEESRAHEWRSESIFLSSEEEKERRSAAKEKEIEANFAFGLRIILITLGGVVLFLVVSTLFISLIAHFTNKN